MTDNVTKDFIARSQEDFLYFNQCVWGTWGMPWDKQIDVWESVKNHKRTTVRSGHSTGKSFIAGKLTIWSLFCWPDSYVITTAPTQRQTDLILWSEIRQCYNKSLINLGGNLLPRASELHIGDKWKAFGFTTGKGTVTDVGQTPMAGFHSNSRVFVIIDEAAGVAPGLFSAVESITTGGNDRILAIGNPTDPQGEFARSFKSPGPDVYGGWNKLKISTLDTPNVKAGKDIIPGLASHTWPEEMKVAYGEGTPMYQAKVLAEFPSFSDDALIPMHFLDLALTRKIEEIKEVPKYNNIGCDIARFGGDDSVIYEVRGAFAKRKGKYSKKDTVEVGRKIHEMQEKEKYTRINIDDDGIGGGTVDYLRKVAELKNIIRINGNARPSQPTKFYNKRAELFWDLRQRFVDRQDIILDCPTTASELAAIEYEYVVKGGEGVVKIKDKKKIKKTLGFSPDNSDALAYAGNNRARRPTPGAVQFV
jgi:hypothetical protein